ncbi:uncharacterized protein LOC126204006 [Schistocerca nitens]|uniref:uncharacterized protein LOC126204006 n=1 Tax=Schistocerca nitens TaxID=7011 RepID=UPI002119937F|nr:uncharacterized protein LOC126204006 [Schistocerca nitens]
MRAEIKATEEQLSTYREDIKATLNRQRIVENSIQSTNDSSLLVEKLRCDLKKQVTLEQIRTEEQTERYQNIVTKYEKLWNGYEAVYNLFPMVPERNNLQLRIKRLEIIVLHKRKLLESEKAKKNQIEAIRGCVPANTAATLIDVYCDYGAAPAVSHSTPEVVGKR